MRITKNVKLLKGKNRFAVYNLNTGKCEPADEIEVELLRKISSGIKLTPKKVNCDNLWSHLSSMRKKGWLEAGQSKPYDIDFTINSTPTDCKNNQFLRVWIELTLFCNLHCNHCYASSDNTVDRTNELNLEEWKIVIKKILSHGVEYITFIGGEPTIRKDLIKSLTLFIKESSPNIKLGIFSNLYQITNSDIDFILNQNLSVSTSLYGINSMQHDTMTNKLGSWAKTTSVIQKLTKQNIRIFVGYFKNDSTCSDSEIKSFIENLGVYHYDIQEHYNVGRAIQECQTKISTNNILPSSISFDPNNLLKYSSQHNCFSDHIAIAPNGDVMGCIMMRKPILGNVLTQSLHTILQNENYLKLVNLTKEKIDGCSVCEFRYACFDCRPGAMGDSDDLLSKPDCGYDPRLKVNE